MELGTCLSIGIRRASRCLVLGALIVACDSDSKETPPPAGTGGRSENRGEAEGAGGTRAPAPEPSAGGPKETAFAATPEAALGSRPKGVGLAVGDALPDVSAEDTEGHAVSLRKLAKERGPLLLVFYRGGWCPHCNFQVRSLGQRASDFERRGILPVVISVDRPRLAARTKQSYEIPFPVLSDSRLAVHEAFHVLNAMHSNTVSRMRNRGIDLEAYSGKAHHTVAIPSVFLIEKDGTVAFAHAARDHKTRPTVDQLLAKIDALRAK